ncbi:hypothetical protein [Aquimarina brevivitae]|uniref:Uncharacterized protein n=1 Tax=Aquimarina brevivitae TaxID=323412 RepID=A0A4Q7P297_9FLAO|nr:hypothetical protein [Aquimarina brevivitae]RZS93874.1 hypothetical protein EV197_2455 [Aquimarina brevivitae]
MKTIIWVLLIIFSSNHLMANNSDSLLRTIDKDEIRNNTTISYINKTLENDYSCTLSFKVYIPTEAGIIGFGMSITADTCEEAEAGIGAAVDGLINEIMR